MKRILSGLVLLFAMLIVMYPISKKAPMAAERDLPAVDKVLERYVEAVGGREAIEKLTTRVCRIEQTHDLNWTDPKVQKVQMETYAKNPHLIVWKEQKPTGDRLEGFDGKNSWHSEGGETVIRKESIPLKQRFIFDPRGPLSVEYYFPNLSVESIEMVEERECYKLQPEGLKEAHFSLYFDVETGLLIRIGHYWDIEDYREIDGVKVPFEIIMGRKGGSSTFAFKSIEHNVPLEDNIFAIPAK
jgi:hypothetical protein